jgi:hypothetical protein
MVPLYGVVVCELPLVRLLVVIHRESVVVKIPESGQHVGFLNLFERH